MSQKVINIAIDGFSATGKSTLAKELAAKLGYRYIDSGAMYRGITYFAQKHGLVNGETIDLELLNHLDKISLEFHHNSKRGGSDLILNGENVEEHIRKLKVAKHVSAVAAISEIRKFLVHQQKMMAAQKGVVMDGRDIGTVVLPDAELKIFVTAREAVRTNRRFLELTSRGDKITKLEVEANLRQRDLLDTTREDSPLVQAEDAKLLDNSEMTREQQLELAMKWVAEKLS